MVLFPHSAQPARLQARGDAPCPTSLVWPERGVNPRRVRIAAHAKANLFLRILARESSGYHSLETLFTLLELADELIIEPAPSGVELTVEGGDTGQIGRASCRERV